MPGVDASNWYGGYAKTTRSPVRVGWAMSAVPPAPFGMYRASALVYVRSMTSQPSAAPSPSQSFGSSIASKASRICCTVASTWFAATCWYAGGWPAGGAGGAGSRPATFR